MRYSTNLSVIIKSVQKATSHLVRDFSELENLQANPASATKYANACYKKIKEIILTDLSYVRPDFNIIFPDGGNHIVADDAEYSYIVNPLDGLYNLSRGIPHFAVSVALCYNDENGGRETIAAVVNNPVSHEMYFCERGVGSYLNNHRIRVSTRTSVENVMIISDEYSLLKNELISSLGLKKIAVRSFGCQSLNICYLAAGKSDLCFFNDKNYSAISHLFLMVRESGGMILDEEGKYLIASNGYIKRQAKSLLSI